MGNEHHLGAGDNADDSGKHQDNVAAFPTGREYADFVNSWAPAIREQFPDAKIGITMLGRVNNNRDRLKFWNNLIVENIDHDNFDAYVYHIYVRPDNTIELNETTIAQIINKRTDTLEQTMIDDESKEVWITEYGVHAYTLEKTVQLTSALADYTESVANISLPQVLYRKSPDYYPTAPKKYFSLLTSPDGAGLTKLGEMFRERVKKRSENSQE